MSSHKTLVYRLLAAILPWYLLLVFGIAAALLATLALVEARSINQDLGALGRTVQADVAESLWEFDSQRLGVMADGVRQNAIVTGVRIVSGTDEIVVAKGDLPPAGKAPNSYFFDGCVQEVIPLFHQTSRDRRQSIGALKLYSNRGVLWNRVKASFSMVALDLSLVAAGLWLILIWGVRSRLSESVTRLALRVSSWRYDTGDASIEKIDYPYQDELGELVLALNEGHTRLLSSQQKLAEFNHDLERTVAIRTRELAKTTHFLDALIDHMPNPVFYKDAQLRYVGCNRAYEKAFGVRRGDMVGKTELDLDYLPVDELNRFQSEQARMLADDAALQREIDLFFADGNVHHVLYSASGFYHADNSPGGVVGVLVDITKQKKTEAALAKAKDAAESADRLKSAFLAVMSHELRTPLNSIIGFTGILLQGLVGPLNEEQQKQMGMVQTSARHLLALINDVLDISKIEAGQFTLARTSFNLRDAIEKTFKLVVPSAEKKGIDLHVEIAPHVGDIVSDQRRLEQVFLNLLNNAVKFTEKGEIRVSCHAIGNEYCFSVSDTGIGIRPEELSGLFQPFHQIDSGLSRKHEGTGLGLSISRKLTEMMGGSIDVQSQWGLGTTLTVRIPKS